MRTLKPSASSCSRPQAMSSADISADAGSTRPTVSPSDNRFGLITRAGALAPIPRAAVAPTTDNPTAQPNALRFIMRAYSARSACDSSRHFLYDVLRHPLLAALDGGDCRDRGGSRGDDDRGDV